MSKFRRLNSSRIVGNLLLGLGLALLIFLPKIVYAHQSGCHRWHSCPSDHGTYVCGDLGYYTYCPNQSVVAAEPTPTSVPTLAPVPTSVPTSTSVSISVSVPTSVPESVMNDAPASISTGEIQATILNVRSGPDISYPVIGTLSQGTQIEMLERGSEWIRFSMSGNADSWVSSIYVTEVQNTKVVESVNLPVDSPETIVNNDNSPQLISPISSQVINDPINFRWFWGGTLASDQGFDVQMWKEGETPMGIAHPSFVVNQGNGNYLLPLPALPYSKGATYFWKVRVVQIETGVDAGPSATPGTFRYE